ncbi:MAG TPA: hypothetical protein VNO70_15985 [Blastocatellia bacterium]|nr:hypothetical protein [Blastocatellia bacterium]
MKYMMFLLALILSFQKPALALQLDLKGQVAHQVDRIRSISGYSEQSFFELPGTSLPGDESPVFELIGYGMDAIPLLTPYLSDTSFTQAVRRHGSGMQRPARVNEYIIFVINRIADHKFYLPPDDRDASPGSDAIPPALPRTIEDLQNQITVWWEKNRTTSLLDRKIDDVNDPIHDNRFAAYEWLGRTRAKEARLTLEQRIEALLTGEVNSLKQSEMAACAESLGQIGEAESIPAVRKVCDHLSYWLHMSYRPIEEGRAGTGSEQISTLFKAFRALAALGLKEEALSHLEGFKIKYLEKMEAHTQRDFLRRFESAKDW